MSLSRAWPAGLLVVALAAASSGCTTPRSNAAAPRAPGAPRVVDEAMPAELLGLRATEEDVSVPLEEAGERAYVTDVRLWALREGERLRATVQVGRFAADAPVSDPAFRDRVAGQVGGTAPIVRKIGEDLVYVGAGNRQTFYGWFRGPHFVLLSVPADATNGRAIARVALREVRP